LLTIHKLDFTKWSILIIHLRIIISDSNDTLLYRQLISDYGKASKYPLIIFLHGKGERGNDNEAQLKWGVMNFADDNIMKTYQPIVIAPQCPDDDYWGGLTYDETPQRGHLLRQMRDQV